MRNQFFLSNSHFLKFLRFFAWLTGIIFGLYVIIVAVVYFNQDSLLMHPYRRALSYKWDVGRTFDECWISVRQDSLNALITHPTQRPRGTVLFFHGNAGDLASAKGMLEGFTDLGYHFATFDYQGFGKSTGQLPDETELIRGAQQFVSFVSSRYPPPYIFCGYSLGSGVAARLAADSQNTVHKLILLAPYYDLTATASEFYPWFPSTLVAYHLAPGKDLNGSKIPLLLVHGQQDGVIHISNSVKLHALLPHSQTLYLPGCGHAGFELESSFFSTINNFLN